MCSTIYSYFMGVFHMINQKCFKICLTFGNRLSSDEDGKVVENVGHFLQVVRSLKFGSVLFE